MRMHLWLPIVGCVWLAMTAPAAGQVKPVTDFDDPQLNRLQQLVPTAPSVAGGEVVQLMRYAASTRRLDAAVLLIRCLAYNLDPTNSNENRGPELMIPAIQLLKDHYGDAVVPLLYFEALSSDRKWFRDRVAAAVQAMLSPAAIRRMNEVFQLDAAGKPPASDLVKSLLATDLKLDYASPRVEELQRLDNAIDAARKRNRP